MMMFYDRAFRGGCEGRAHISLAYGALVSLKCWALHSHCYQARWVVSHNALDSATVCSDTIPRLVSDRLLSLLPSTMSGPSSIVTSWTPSVARAPRTRLVDRQDQKVRHMINYCFLLIHCEHTMCCTHIRPLQSSPKSSLRSCLHRAAIRLSPGENILCTILQSLGGIGDGVPGQVEMLAKAVLQWY
jgi:hypothetical protein